jgi:hypothetical protein
MIRVEEQRSDINKLLTFAFVIYGRKHLYLEGLQHSIAYLTMSCPEKFSVLVYHDHSVPEWYMTELRKHTFVDLVDCSQLNFCSQGDLRASWRFMALEDATRDRVVICDVDEQEVQMFMENYYHLFIDDEKQKLSRPLLLYYTPSWTHIIDGSSFVPRLSAGMLAKSGFLLRGVRQILQKKESQRQISSMIATTNRGARYGYGQDEIFLNDYVLPILGQLNSIDLNLVGSEEYVTGIRTRSKSKKVMKDIQQRKQKRETKNFTHI